MARRLFILLLVAAGTAAIAVQAAPAATNVLVSGTIVDANQKPLPQLQVYLYLPPATPATSYKLSPVGTAVTDAAGRFSIAPERTSVFQKAAAVNDGWVNFDLVATDGKLTVYRSVPRQLVKTQWVGPAENNGSTDLSTVPLAPGQPGVGPVTRRSLSAVATCTESSTVLATASATTTIGELHTFNGSATFTYGPTADSFIDAVVQVGSAPWSESVGTVHIGNTLTAATVSAAAGFHRLLRTPFSYRKARTVNTCTGARVTIKALSWATAKLSLAKTTDGNSTCSAAHRQSFAAGSQFLRNANTAHKWIPAVNLTALGGPAALAGARSGYSARVWAKWTFASAGSLCGDTALPATASRIFAGP